MSYLHKFFFVVLIGLPNGLSAQNLIINGSFESNNAVNSYVNLSDPWTFDTYLPELFFIGGTFQLINPTYPWACPDPQDGEWLLQNTQDYGGSLGFYLTQPVLAGYNYEFTCYTRTCIFTGEPQAIYIDLTNSFNPDYSSIDTIQNAEFDTIWKQHSFIFSPDTTYNFVTISIFNVSFQYALQVDNFSLVELPTGVNTATNDADQLVIFPNPGHNDFNLTWNKPTTEKTELFVYDLLGNKISSALLPVGQSNYLLSLNAVPPGVYSVMIKNKTEVITSLLVVQ